MNSNIKAIAESLARSVKELIEPLHARIKNLEDRAPVKGDKGDQGDKGDKGDAGPAGANGIDGAAGLPGEKGDPGQHGERGERGPQGEPGPAGADGAAGLRGEKGDPGERGDRGERGLQGEPGPAGADGLPGRAGIDGEAGKDGKDGRPGERGEKGDRGEVGEKGETGAEGRALTIDDVKDFLDAGLSKWLLDADRLYRKHVDDFIASLPVPKDGIDGLPVESMAWDQDTRTAHFIRDGKSVHELKIPVPKWMGVWGEGDEYELQMQVTFGGNVWICVVDKTTAKPGTNADWVLCVKKGRDGRDKK